MGFQLIVASCFCTTHSSSKVEARKKLALSTTAYMATLGCSTGPSLETPLFSPASTLTLQESTKANDSLLMGSTAGATTTHGLAGGGNHGNTASLTAGLGVDVGMAGVLVGGTGRYSSMGGLLQRASLEVGSAGANLVGGSVATATPSSLAQVPSRGTTPTRLGRQSDLGLYGVSGGAGTLGEWHQPVSLATLHICRYNFLNN
ncbi:unnamed protein product [Protopolystoma xenopodis]|uniref:Uncharacterized protein n=1 Tax=Protopolystoma xenopodis TaxID=117903 RepID=A0A448X542_9PLAT|nr:unnamed protein product [Protopolystoma xenopodis]